MDIACTFFEFGGGRGRRSRFFTVRALFPGTEDAFAGAEDAEADLEFDEFDVFTDSGEMDGIRGMRGERVSEGVRMVFDGDGGGSGGGGAAEMGPEGAGPAGAGVARRAGRQRGRGRGGRIRVLLMTRLQHRPA